MPLIQKSNILANTQKPFIPKYLPKIESNIIVYIVSSSLDGIGKNELEEIKSDIKFYNKNIKVITFPSWNCNPFDIILPSKKVLSKRIKAIKEIPNISSNDKTIILTTASSLLKKINLDSDYETITLLKNETINIKALIDTLINYSYLRVETVREFGEFSIRGGIIDIFSLGAENPVRIDLFDNEIESIKEFDSISQLTHKNKEHTKHSILPVNEIILNEYYASNFIKNYNKICDPKFDKNSFILENLKNNIFPDGKEHFLNMFCNNLSPFFSFIDKKNTSFIFDKDLQRSIEENVELINKHYELRKNDTNNNLFHLLDNTNINDLYQRKEDFIKSLKEFQTYEFSEYNLPNSKNVFDSKSNKINLFINLKINEKYEKLKHLILNTKKSIFFSFNSKSSLRIIEKSFEKYKINNIFITNYSDKKANTLNTFISKNEEGYETPTDIIITEKDFFGFLIESQKKKQIKVDNFIKEVTSIKKGDLLVHISHGVGLFEELETIRTNESIHDCVKILYQDGARLYVPIENIDNISFYGETNDKMSKLDKLGGDSWKRRKKRIEKNILEIADKLIEIAAKRKLSTFSKIHIDKQLEKDFSKDFPYTLTDDQDQSIKDIENDLTKGLPMDRLICGDVGYGKTEVALRSAFNLTVSSFQVLLIAPTTILVRQHFNTFKERFSKFSINVRQISRLVNSKEVKETKNGLENGTIDIVIGTHALLSNSIKCKNLGMVIIDEEQHFGVKQKEKLKQLREKVHVLSMSATPIPRTLQMSLTGIKQMSIISTPPAKRKPINTFVIPYDKITIKDALMREKSRSGQSFYVCPRIKDMGKIEQDLKKLVPNLKIAIANGAMEPSKIEDVMLNFTKGNYDILLATNIIESGIDIPTANTMIIHNSNMFGLSQLYQLRGRIGRSNKNSYCYITYRNNLKLTKDAQKRFSVLSSLNKLGGGFSLASQDLDIRGAGNLLGDKQSGNIKEVGVELYQSMLKDAINNIKNERTTEYFSPKINVPLDITIPNSYIKDIDTRMSVYKKLVNCNTNQEIDSITIEIINRFGDYPKVIDNLLKIIALKILCKKSKIEKIDIGSKGASIKFYKNYFPNIKGLITYIQNSRGMIKVNKSNLLIIEKYWDTYIEALESIQSIIKDLNKIN